MRDGLSGILRPNGKFIECKHGEHFKIAREIKKSEEELCIVLSSSKTFFGNCDSSTIYCNENITRKQYKWLRKNSAKFDEAQYEMFLKIKKPKKKSKRRK